MSSEQEDVDGLPTAAKWLEFSKVDPDFGEGADFMRVNAATVELSHEDELVRRKDVTQLIQDKLSRNNVGKRHGNCVCKSASRKLCNSCQRARSRKQVLDELLDEVQHKDA